MRRTAVVLAAVVALSGCGTETSGTSTQGSTATSSTSVSPTPSEEPDAQPSEQPSEQPSKKGPTTPPADAPECAAVWVDGTTLARTYKGCRAGQRFIAPDEEPCSFGQRLVRFSDHFYAVRGGPVNRTAAPLGKDRVYRGALASCRA